MIVADASPLIFLGRLGCLGLLPELFGEVLVPEAVALEATSGPGRPGAAAARLALHDQGFQTVVCPPSAALDELTTLVDAGEAAAIAVALDRDARGILIDDRAGRSVATSRGLAPVGTLGVLVQARRAGLVGELEPVLDELERAGFRMSAALRAAVLRLPD